MFNLSTMTYVEASLFIPDAGTVPYRSAPVDHW
jgi:hypothetical protein